MKPGRRRMAIAFAISLLVHIMLFSPVVRLGAPELPKLQSPVTVVLAPKPEVRLPEAQTFVDSVRPSDEPVGPTDLIAEANSKASDGSDVVGTRLAPFVEMPSESDRPAGPRAESVKAASPPEPQQKPKSKPKEKSKPAEQKPSKEDSTMLLAAVPQEMAAAKPQEPAPQPEQTPDVSAGGEIGSAGAPPGLSPGQARGRVDGGVLNDGFLGFEALKSDIAPYLKEIRKRVEQKWFAAMAFRYPGVAPTKAVVDCAIARDGKLVRVTIREEGAIPLFAQICKDSIEKAGPFSAFPFEVPDMYANKDLEIRWTFSFLS